MKYLYFLLICLFSINLNAQENKDLWVVQDTRLYTNADLKSDFYGYFRYGSRVKVLEQKGNWSKVESDNQTIGFVPTKHLNHSMMYNDVNIPDKENPILQKDDYYGNVHMFVTVAGLKARKGKSSTSKIDRILLNGDALSVTYFPKNTEEWVNIQGSGYGVTYSYVQAKYLGKRPVFDDLVKQFDAIPNNKIEEQKKCIERLVELSWSEKRENLIPAYKRYIKVAEKLNDEKLLHEVKMTYEIAQALNLKKPVDSENEGSFYKYQFLHKDKVIGTSGNLYSDLLTTFGKPISEKIISDECGVNISELLYHYTNFDAYVDQKENVIDVVFLKMATDFSFKLDENHILISTFTEENFIADYKGMYDYHARDPHSFYFYSDGGSITINFENGVISTIEVFYYC